MIEFNELINTCYLGVEAISSSTRTIAYYSHLIPIFFTLFLIIILFLKSKKNILSKIFIAFGVVFCFWLTADLVTWVSNNYFLIYAFWSPVDYIESVMFVLGLYFVLVFIKKKDLSFIPKVILFLATLLPLIITATQNAVSGFYYPVCEAINNNFLLHYRFYLEIIVVSIIFIFIIINILKKSVINKKSILTVLGSVFLFLSVFGVTSYLSAVTTYYELNLYALFIIPAFLMAITYSIFSLDIFNIKIISTYFIVFGLVILTASQLLFITSTTNRLLTTITVILSILLSYILFKNLKKESDQRKHIEVLSQQLEASKMRLEESNFNRELANDKLKELDKLKTEFLSLASHQLRSPLTAISGYTSMILDGDYGEINSDMKETIDRVYKSSKSLTKVVEDLLNVSKIEQGGMKYEMNAFDLADLTKEMVDNLSINAKDKGLDMTFECNAADKYVVVADKEKIRQVILNLIDNSIKYTKAGSIQVSLKKIEGKVVLSVKDTGMGMTEETKKKLFVKFERGEGGKVNSDGTGLGLYLTKEIIEAHNGYVWVESDGEGKGSNFIVELKAIE